MATALEPLYGSSAALTVTNLASLASDTNLLAGWSSAVIANGTNRLIAEKLTGSIKTGTSPTAGTYIYVYVWTALDDTPTYPDTISGSEGLVTLTSKNVRDAGAFRLADVILVDSTSNRIYMFAFDVARFFGGHMPKNYGLWIVHNTGANLNATQAVSRSDDTQIIVDILAAPPPGSTPYDGISATRGMPPTILAVSAATGLGATQLQMQTRTGHRARSALTNIKIIVPNFWMDFATSAEVGPGASTTVTASIEYPVGTFTQLKFGGNVSGTIADLSTIESDFATVSIPNNALFWVRMFCTNSGGVVYRFPTSQDTANMGDVMATAVSGLSDQTMGGTITDWGVGGVCFPLAIISTITVPSVGIVGDSISSGAADLFFNASGDLGFINRAVGVSFGYSNLATPGDMAKRWVTNGSTQRRKVFPYFSTLISGYPRNDLNDGDSVATAEGNLTTIYNQCPASVKQILELTVVPFTNVSDGSSWTNLTSQTVGSWEANRVSFNTRIRGGTFVPAGLTIPFGFCDAAATVESSLNSGKWIATVFTGRIDNGTPGNAGTTLTVSAVTSGIIIIPATIFGTSLSGTGTFIVSQTSGTTGGVGVYVVNNSLSIASETIIVPNTSDGSHPTTIGSMMMAASGAINLSLIL